MRNQPNLKPVTNDENLPQQTLFLPNKNYRTIIIVLCVTILLLLCGHIYVFSNSFTQLNNQISDLRKEINVLHMAINENNNEILIYYKILVLNPKIKPKLAKQIAQSINKWSTVYDRDPDLMLCLILVESNFDPKVISKMGAEGLTQIMPFWYDIFKIPEGSFFEVDKNIQFGHQILLLYEKQYGNVELALAAYNRGTYLIESDLLKGKDPRNDYAIRIMKLYRKLKKMNHGSTE